MKQLEPDLSRCKPWGIQITNDQSNAITWRFHNRAEAEQVAAFYRRIMPSCTFHVLYLADPPTLEAIA